MASRLQCRRVLHLSLQHVFFPRLVCSKECHWRRSTECDSKHHASEVSRSWRNAFHDSCPPCHTGTRGCAASVKRLRPAVNNADQSKWRQATVRAASLRWGLGWTSVAISLLPHVLAARESRSLGVSAP